MRHPGCHIIDTAVVDSRWREGRIRRRRRCPKCGARFNTYEITFEEYQILMDQLEILNELESPIWAVVSFDKVEGTDLTRAQADLLLDCLDGAEISGLVIITAAAAARTNGSPPYKGGVDAASADGVVLSSGGTPNV